MGFSLLLALLATKFKKASKLNENFKKFLMGHECTVVIKTKDGKRGKRFLFRDGRFSTDAVLDDYDTAMIWGDAQTAFPCFEKGGRGDQGGPAEPSGGD